jgi:hypothetical protein
VVKTIATKQKDSDRRLINEPTLLLLPTLAKAIDLNSAILLQQIHYWVTVAAKSGNNYRDGHFWTYNSVREWCQQFPWWSTSTIRRTLDNLEAKGILITGCYNRLPIDRTKWYRINYKTLCRFIQNEQIELCKMGKCDLCNLSEPLPKTSVPNTSETGTGNYSENNSTLSYFQFKEQYQVDSETDIAISFYLDEFKRILGKEHMKLKPETWQSIIDTLLILDDSGKLIRINIEHFAQMVDHYFTKVYNRGRCDRGISHFNNGAIKKINYFEAAPWKKPSE